MTYVLRYDQDRAHLVGPFDDVDQAVRWSKSPANNPNDDPRWAIIGNTDVRIYDPLDFVVEREVIYLSYSETTIVMEN
jgi:hypothetical protein